MKHKTQQKDMETLYLENKKTIMEYASYFVSPYELEDAYQEIFLKSIKGFNKKKGQFKDWIFKIAKNHLSDIKRKEMSKTDILPIELEDESLNFFKTLLEKEKSLLVESLIESIKDKSQKEILHLIYFEDKTYDVISEECGIDREKVKKIHYTLLKSLREKLHKGKKYSFF